MIAAAPTMPETRPFLPNVEPIAVVFTAVSWTEAVVIRGLLESSGIPSPALGDGYPPDLVLLGGIEIYALESHAQSARELIAEYLAGADGLPDGEEYGGSNNSET